MFLAVHGSPVAVHIEARLFHTGLFQAALGNDVDHTILNVFLAVERRRTSLQIEARRLGTFLVRALPHYQGRPSI